VREPRECDDSWTISRPIACLKRRLVAGIRGGRLPWKLMGEDDYRRYVHVNLPHSRTIIQRIARSLEALGAFGEVGNGGAIALHTACETLKEEAEPFDEDPRFEEALGAADKIANRARELVSAILATPVRGDRLGQLVRNLFECLGLPEEGATLSIECGEHPDSPLR
jgi:hypothetical protein